MKKIEIQRHEHTVSVTGSSFPFEIALPASLPLDIDAVTQLVAFTQVQTPSGIQVINACATPDFHKGSSIPVGAVIATPPNMVIPKAVGTDINCGMRLHAWDISVDQFLAKKATWLKLMHGDILEGSRNLPGNRQQMIRLAEEGLPGWIEEVSRKPIAMWAATDWQQHYQDLDLVFQYGWLPGDATHLPSALLREGVFRDPCFATLGSGNHFLEVGYVAEVYDRHAAYEWGLAQGKVTVMIHTGSRDIGFHVGAQWMDKAKALHPKGRPHPESGIYALENEGVAPYLAAMNTAANYAFANRLALAELVRQRCEQVYGAHRFLLVSDIPHNIATLENGQILHRKGSTPAREGDRLIIPGSMGDSSFVLKGLGCDRFLNTASHGAGRAHRRQKMRGADTLMSKGECIALKEERKAEEAPAAYKPVLPVVDTQVALGMVQKVARIEPLLTFKA